MKLPKRSGDESKFLKKSYSIRTYILVIAVAWLAALPMAWLVTFMFGGPGAGTIETAAQIGDSFGAINALFSGLAFAFVIYSLYLQRQDLRNQQEELKLQREEMGRQREELSLQREEMELQRQEFVENRVTNIIYKQLEKIESIHHEFEYRQIIFKEVEKSNQSNSDECQFENYDFEIFNGEDGLRLFFNDLSYLCTNLGAIEFGKDLPQLFEEQAPGNALEDELYGFRISLYSSSAENLKENQQNIRNWIINVRQGASIIHQMVNEEQIDESTKALMKKMFYHNFNFQVVKIFTLFPLFKSSIFESYEVYRFFKKFKDRFWEESHFLDSQIIRAFPHLNPFQT